MNAEEQRLAEDRARTGNWKRWGPYLAERQWGTVREDYSADGDCWTSFPHEQAHQRAYRWGEDGLLGITDRECRLCFALALWNGKDPILKERLFGLTNAQGNHGEDVKECYYFLDSTPTHSYMRALYRYPQAEFPYRDLVEENGRRKRNALEYELSETGVWEGNRFFDIVAEYAKGDPDDMLIRVTVTNRGPETATMHLLPTLWYRNTWAWGNKDESPQSKPKLSLDGASNPSCVRGEHSQFGKHTFIAGQAPDGTWPELIFTENETNSRRLFGAESSTRFTKDAFHEYVVGNQKAAVNPEQT